jgi:Ni,Fe-hydrogenase III large subunit
LKMEWISTPFGPFFPGLPAGLGLTLTLDGDTVVEARAQSLAGVSLDHGSDPRALADRLAELSPLAPVAMRQLACLALAAAASQAVALDKAKAHAAAVERERIDSHLNWLAGFGAQVGMIWLERRAAAWQLKLRRADVAEIAARSAAIRAFIRRVRATPLLRAKLAGIGKLDSETAPTGPIARAAGGGADARAGDPIYAALGFAIVTQSAGDALARLYQRLDEIAQSLDLIARAGAIAMPEPGDSGAATRHGMAEVETPRGLARLHLTLNQGRVETAEITTPFAAQSGLIDAMSAQSELADALTAIGSLDLDPWEIAP